jgi:tRNA pseudouridine55 synthase
MATGVLVVLVGRAAKACEYSLSDRKKYTATLRLGIETDTEDTTGNIIRETDVKVFENDVQAILERFKGRIMQIPPMYSALKVGGKKLYELARQGIEIEREARPITIHSLSSTPTERDSDYILEVSCSSGTYIRTLCADIGKRLGCGGAMASLRRTETGGFPLSACFTLEALEALDFDARLAALVPTEQLFVTLPALKLPAFYERLSRNGCEIYLKKLGVSHPVGARLRVCSADGSFFALGEVREYPDGVAVKIIKLFDV